MTLDSNDAGTGPGGSRREIAPRELFAAAAPSFIVETGDAA
ncbi:MAG: hypothetical protein ACRCSL_09400 [Microbacterium sp.]